MEKKVKKNEEKQEQNRWSQSVRGHQKYLICRKSNWNVFLFIRNLWLFFVHWFVFNNSYSLLLLCVKIAVTTLHDNITSLSFHLIHFIMENFSNESFRFRFSLFRIIIFDFRHELVLGRAQSCRMVIQKWWNTKGMYCHSIDISWMFRSLFLLVAFGRFIEILLYRRLGN